MKVDNKSASRDYEILERFEAGISLLGAEVKQVKAGKILFEGSHVRIMGDGVYLVNAQIPVYEHARPEGYDPRRSRKLLLHKAEILRIRTKLKGGGRLTIVPISCYNKKHIIKLEIALVRGRGEIEKKKVERRQDIKRAQQREAKEYMKR